MRAPLSWLREYADLPLDVTGRELAERLVAAGLAEGGIEAAGPFTKAPEHHVCVTDAGEKFHRLAGRILGEDVTLEWVEVT